MNRKTISYITAAAALVLLLNTGCARTDSSLASERYVQNFGAETTESTENTQNAVTTDQGAAQNTPSENNGTETTVNQADEGVGGTASETQYDPYDSPYADADRYPYYAQLSDNEKIVYLQIVEQVGAGIPNITPEATIDGDALNAVVDAVYREQPQLFWLENEWTWYSSALTGSVTSITMKFNELADALDENIAAFQAAGEAALQGLDGLSDAEKELAIHDYLASNTTYAQNDLDQSAYSALVNHSSVCCGFTRAFQYLMQCEGIPTYFCQGTADGFNDGTNGADHAWDIVKLGDGYYNVDVTWDETALSAQGLVIYSYFNRTDEVFDTDHFRDASSEFLPACTAAEFSYEALRGVPAELGVTAQMNLDSSDPITSLDAFYQIMENSIIAVGTGTHTFNYVVYGDDCMASIADAVSSNAIQSGFLDDAALAIGLNGYSSTLSYQELELGNGYYYISLTIELSAN